MRFQDTGDLLVILIILITPKETAAWTTEPKQELRGSLGILVEGGAGLALWGGSQWPSAEQKTQPSGLPFSSWNVRCHVLPWGLGICSVPCLSALPPGLHLVKPSNPASSSEASLSPNWPLGPPPAHMLPGYLLRALPQEACCLSGSFQSPSKWKSSSIPVSSPS